MKRNNHLVNDLQRAKEWHEKQSGFSGASQDYHIQEASLFGIAIEEILHLRQSQDKIWGIADEVHMAEMERIIDDTMSEYCFCNDEKGWDPCLVCEAHDELRKRLGWSQSVNQKDSTFNSTEATKEKP